MPGEDWGRTMGERTNLHTCTLCEAMCGLEIQVEDDRVALIRADREDVWSKGYLCPKGTALGHVHTIPTACAGRWSVRATSWREVSWDEAFARCEDLLHPVIDEHGIGAVTAFVGNPTAHNFSLGRYVGILIAMSGIPMIYSSGTVDQWPKNLSSLLMYGGMWTFPVPDVPRTDLWVIMGANPQASTGVAAGLPRPARPDRPHPRRPGGARSWSTPGAPGPPTGPTNGCRSCRGPMPRCPARPGACLLRRCPRRSRGTWPARSTASMS